MSDLEKKLAGLSPAKRKLFEMKLKKMAQAKAAERLDSTRRSTIPRREGEGPWPASIDQTALWFFYQLDKEAVPYNNATGKILRGPLDVSVLERAYNEIIARHEILRTTFKVIDGQLCQVIAPKLELSIPVHDMRYLSEEELMPTAMKILPQMVREPFDMETGPLLRLPLLRLRDQEYIYAFIMHHAITDWWSFKLFAQELLTLYAYFMQGKPSPLKEPDIQFADYTVYRNKWLNSPDYEDQLAYWLKKLDGAPMLLDLPKDKPRPPVPTYNGVRVWTHRDTSKVLYGTRDLTRVHNASSLMISMTAIFCFLARYCGVKDVLISTPMTDRDNPELENLFGYMLNVMVMRCKLYDNQDGVPPSFNELVQQVKKTTLEAQKNRDLPFRVLVENMNIDREISHMPVYQIDYNHISLDGPVFQDHKSLDALNLPGYEIVDLDYDRGVATVDLQFTLMEGPDELIFWLEYATDLFEHPTAEHMEELFFALFEQLLEHPDKPYTEVDWIPVAERTGLMETWQGPRAAYSCDQTLHGNFEAMADQFPDTIAVIEGTRNITYSDLEGLSSRIASHLISAGVKPGDAVGLYLNSGIHWAAGILGILRAGGMYVPMAVDFPRDRMAFIMAETEMKIVLSLEAYEEQLAFGKDHGVRCLMLDRAAEGWDDAPGLTAPIFVPSTLPAYAIYTSGTTGTPKGVVVDHRGSIRLVHDQRHVPFGPGNVFSQISKISFDAHIMELWTPLSHGGCLSIVSQETLLNAGSLAQQVKRDGVDFMFMTPSLAARFVDDCPEMFDDLEVLVLGGEAADAATIRRITERGRGVHVLNTYGPTETTVYMTIHDMSSPGEVTDNVPIGLPVCHSTMHLLDRDFQLAPCGVIGEITIGGEGLAMGYVKRPGATAAVFIPNPFAGKDGSQPGSRLYRSGDLGKRLANGSVQFEGRFDHQVKLRGLRIELGEIESVLVTHPAIAEAVAVMLEGASGKVIAAYIRLEDPEAATPPTDALRDHLMEKVPEYMTPSIFVTLDAFPVTPNGKLDRKALPDPDFKEKGSDYAPPRNDTEEILAGIWARRLGLERVGINDNFFRLGGDSILAIRVVAEAAEAGLMLSTMQLFQNQTIARLSGCLKQTRVIHAEQGLIEGKAPLTPIQKWFFEHGAPHHFNMAVALEASETPDAELLARAWEQVVDHHDALRLRFPEQEGVRVQFFDPAKPPLEVVECSDLQALEETAARIQTQLNPESGPVARALLVRLKSGGGDRFVLIAHHLICDTTSLRTILEDLERTYTVLVVGKTPMLPHKTTSWKTWSTRLENHSRAPEIVAQLPWWQNVCQSNAARLAYDFSDRPQTVHAAAELKRALEPSQTTALLQDIPAVYNTRINDLLLAALTLAYGRLTGVWTTRITMEGHGREDLFEDIDTTRTAGWFSTSYPVLLTLEEAMPSEMVIKTIKEQLRAVPQKGMGYGLLRYLNPETATAFGDNGASQLIFNYLGRYDDLEQEGMFRLTADNLGPVRSDQDRAPEDLELTGVVIDDKLQFIWKYSNRHFGEDTVARLADTMIEELAGLIRHCREPGVYGRTPSDYPQLPLAQKEVDAWMERFGSLDDILPVTPMQEGMLFHTLHTPETEPYVEAKGYRFLTRIHAEHMQTGLQAIVDRHPVLRSVYQSGNQSIAMLILAEHILDFRLVDHPVADFDTLRQKVFDEPLDPFSKPPLQARLVCHGDQDWRLMLRFHHVILDGWSIAVIMEEALTGYALACEGKQASFEDPRPYSDYVAWLNAQDPAKAENFWREHLRGFETPNELTPESRGNGAHEIRRYGLDSDHFLPMLTMAREIGVTVNTLVQAAWSIILSRSSGTDDVVFGMTGSGRPPELDGMERMVGLFISTLPMRLNIDNDKTAAEFLKELQMIAAEVRQYEYSALADIKKYSDLGIDQQLFQSMIVFENYPAEELLRRVDKRLECHEINETGSTDMPLTLVCGGEDSLFVLIDYDTELFTETRIEGIWQSVKTLLEAMAIHPECRVCDLPMMSEARKRDLLVSCSREDSVYPEDKNIWDLFARQARQNPESIAIRTLDEAVTYQELVTRAAGLAPILKKQGLGYTHRAGLMIDQTRPEVFIAALAILGAGGAYVPLDPSLPARRLNYIIADSRISLVLADHVNHTLHVDQTLVLGDQIPLKPEGDPALIQPIHPFTPAYVMYTSGTTGQPKGVIITHQNIVRLVHGVDYFDISSQRVILHASVMSFDAATFELWGALLTGACLVPGSFRKVDDVLELIRKCNVDTLSVTAQMFNLMVDNYLDQMSPLKQIITGGEAMSVDHKNRLLEKLPHVRLVNGYGPTENTVYAVCGDMEMGARAPIGVPNAGVGSFILDHHLNLLPVGVRGELYLSGDGLAAGYQNHPALTAHAFVPSPFAGEHNPGARLYATGDLVSIVDDLIYYHGRKDRQIKLRGFRLELTEVEVALRSLDEVEDAVVQVRGQHGEERLVAWVRGDDLGASVAESLSARLRKTLPDYMIPANIIVLDAFPIKSSGKIDNAALPEPDATGVMATYTPPRNQAEQILAQIWSKRLGRERVGIHDNFFRLGGDSIQAIRIAAQAAEAGLHLKTMHIFEHQTIAGLAAALAEQRVIDAEQGLVSGQAPVTAIQGYFLSHYLATPSHFNMSLAVKTHRRLNTDLLEPALQHVVHHHDSLRLRYPLENGCRLQIFARDAGIQLEIIDLEHETEPLISQEKLAAERQASLDIEAGPIVCILYCRMDSGDRLIILAHHLICDIVSLRIILEDLERAYLVLEAGGKPQLPRKTSSWKAWATRMDAYSRSQTITDQLDWWVERDRVRTAELPVQCPVEDAPPDSRSAINTRLDKQHTYQLLYETMHVYNTRINDVLLAALTLALRSVTGNDTARISVETHGREELFDDLDTNRTVGWFTILSPVLIHLPENLTSSEVLKSAKEQLRAIPQNGIGYGLLRYVNAETGPRFDGGEPARISFNYLGRFDKEQDSNLFELTDDPLGPTRSGRDHEYHHLDINCVALDNCLELVWSFNNRILNPQTVEALALAMNEALCELIDHCQQPDAGGNTPSDFPHLLLTQQDVDDWQTQYGKLEDILPVTPMQEGMLFHSLVAPETGAYTELRSFRFKGDIDPERLRDNLQAVVDRHGILRSFYKRRGEAMTMLMLRHSQLDFQSLEMEDADFEQLCERVFDHPLDPFSGVPLQARLICHKPGEWRLLMRFHHVLSDGWSMSIIMEEMMRGYDSPEWKPQEPVPYRNYINWLTGQNRDRAMDFWREHLSGFEEPSSLVSEPGFDNGKQKSIRYDVGSDLYQSMQSTVRTLGITANTMVQAVWALVLGRLTGSDDVVFGMTGSGRPPEVDGMDRMVGMFINTLPLRLKPLPGESCAHFLAGVQMEAARVRQYEYSALPEIKQISGLQQGEELFDSIVVFENYPTEEVMKHKNHDLICYEVEDGTQTNVPLALAFWESDTLNIQIDYDSNLFTEGQAGDFIRYLLCILERMSKAPQEPVAHLSLISVEDRGRLLQAYNREDAAYPKDKNIWDLFARQAEQNPESIAIRTLDETVTYKELANRAAGLVTILKQKGLGYAHMAGLMIDQTRPEVFVAALAILGAGGAYVPLDPSLPARRLNYIIADSQISLVLADHVDDGLHVDQTLVLGDQIPLKPEGDPALMQPIHPLTPAYVMYTSGTTGQPKGVIITHQNIVRLVHGVDYFDISSERVILHASVMSFDAATFELWGALLTGACLVPGSFRKVGEVPELIRKCNVDTLSITAQMFNLMVDNYLDQMSGLKQVITGGEAMSVDHKNRLLEKLPHVRLVNGYGPTENTVYAVCGDMETGALAPIGVPNAGVGVFILDHHLHLLPAGARGELYLSGDGLATGYQNHPALTADVFVPSPFSGEANPGARLYATGDLVSIEDGLINFHCRKDRQIKLRGFRLELTEIEIALRSLDKIEDAVVQVRGQRGEERLVAWVRGQDLRDDEGEIMTRELRLQLPEYMIPVIHILDAFPTKSSGKIDTAALEEGERSKTLYAAPQTPIEQAIIDAWLDVLHIDKLGIHDNFFEAGAHSLTTIRFLARLSETTGLELDPQVPFQAPTAALLARQIEARSLTETDFDEGQGEEFEF